MVALSNIQNSFILHLNLNLSLKSIFKMKISSLLSAVYSILDFKRAVIKNKLVSCRNIWGGGETVKINEMLCNW